MQGKGSKYLEGYRTTKKEIEQSFGGERRATREVSSFQEIDGHLAYHISRCLTTYKLLYYVAVPIARRYLINVT